MFEIRLAEDCEHPHYEVKEVATHEVTQICTYRSKVLASKIAILLNARLYPEDEVETN